MTSARFGTAGMGSTTFVEDRSRTRNALADPVYSYAEKAAAEDLATAIGLEGYLEGYLAGARAALEGDLAAIEDGTGASFTVGSSPTASPCQAGKSGTWSRVGVSSGGVRDTGQPHAEPQKR
jgi:hypothetical protein